VCVKERERERERESFNVWYATPLLVLGKISNVELKLVEKSSYFTNEQEWFR
jgi:hypothetical protein